MTLTLLVVSVGADLALIGAGLWPGDSAAARLEAWVDASASGSLPATHRVAAVWDSPPVVAGVTRVDAGDGNAHSALLGAGLRVIREDP
jgi:hypothetical protein